MLDEFGEELDQAAAGHSGGARTTALYERVLGEYGDDSVAQLGGAHIACEWSSNVLTKILQRPRLGAYLEQSTRYIPYDRPMAGGGYRYHRAPELDGVLRSRHGQPLRDLCLAAGACRGMGRRSAFPKLDSESQAAHERAVRAKALDLLRGLLPAASLSHVGIFATRPDLRAADPPPAGPPAGRGPRLRRADAGGHAGRGARASSRGSSAPSAAVSGSASCSGGPRAKRPSWSAWAWTTSRRPESAGVRLIRVEGSEPELLLAALLFEGSCARRSRDRRAHRRTRRPRAQRPRSPSSSVAARTAATSPAAASRRSAIASRSSPTTAPSGTCSATGC